MLPTPTRTFIVTRTRPGTNGPGETEAVEAHQPHIGPEGSLTLLRYDDLNRVAWSMAQFAPGTWYGVRATIPGIEDIRVMDANEAEAKAEALKRSQFEESAVREYINKGRGTTKSN